ncbi:MAG: phosphoribosyltransferase family protein [Sedimentisphaerales bacterium]
MGSLNILTYHEEVFSDRKQAAEMLSLQLSEYRAREDAVVLGIPRGGVVVAGTIADSLDAELDIVLTRKIGAPLNPELAAGAVSEDGKLYLNKAIVSSLGISQEYISKEKSYQLDEISKQKELYRKVLEKKSLRGMVVILTDDGIATGATMQAAIWASIAEFPQKIVLAVPVAPPETLEKFSQDVDETICLCAPENFRALSQFYTYFEQVDDEQVIEILKKYSKVKK